MEFKNTANAEAIITLMAANFEHMWFISWRRPSLPQDAPLTLALISGLASECDFRHIQGFAARFGGP